MTPILIILSQTNGTFTVQTAYGNEFLAICQTYKTAVIVGRCIQAATGYHADF